MNLTLEKLFLAHFEQLHPDIFCAKTSFVYSYI
uniref:Uncharacterized protein n=1 Tax=Anguilla anguilla TaxID=7936 RepID=A0A0E9TK90_ANGAN